MPGGLGSAWLTYERDGETVRIDLTGEKVQIGRSRSCDVVLSLRGVSRTHCTAEHSDNGWIICDNKSSNGTFVNRRRVQRVGLNDGDEITFGPPGVVPVVLTFHEHVDVQQSEAGPVAFHDESPEARPDVSAAVSIEQFGRNPDIESQSPVVSQDAAGPAGMQSLDADDSGLDDAPSLDEAAGAPPGSSPGDPLGRAGNEQRALAALISLFAQMADALLRSPTLDEMLKRVVDLLFKALPARRGSIWLYDEAGGTVSARAVRNHIDPAGEPTLISRSIVNEAFRTRQAILVNTPVQDERFQHAVSIANMDVNSALCAPLFRNDRFLGFIYFDSPSEGAGFSERHLELLTTIAQFTVEGIERQQPNDGQLEN